VYDLHYQQSVCISCNRNLKSDRTRKVEEGLQVGQCVLFQVLTQTARPSIPENETDVGSNGLPGGHVAEGEEEDLSKGEQSLEV
jgi:hypothetical protein